MRWNNFLALDLLKQKAYGGSHPMSLNLEKDMQQMKDVGVVILKGHFI
jgi:hypothetical protein